MPPRGEKNKAHSSSLGLGEMRDGDPLGHRCSGCRLGTVDGETDPPRERGLGAGREGSVDCLDGVGCVERPLSPSKDVLSARNNKPNPLSTECD